jgi:predicted DNA-binding transcriptional regulator AlpA
MSEPTDEPLMTNAEVATLLLVGQSTLFEWRRRGLGPPFYEVDQLVRYRRSELLEWLRQQRVEPDQ